MVYAKLIDDILASLFAFDIYLFTYAHYHLKLKGSAKRTSYAVFLNWERSLLEISKPIHKIKQL